MSKARIVALAVALVTVSSSYVLVRAQGAVGQNVNVVTGSTDQFTGDMFRQRQNEPVIGISSINPMHMMAAYNDYRTVDYPLDVSTVPPSLWARLREFLKSPFKREGEREGAGEEEDEKAAANAWIGVSFRDGQQWYSGLHPGHHLLPPVNGAQGWDQSPQLTAFDAASDPVMATTQNQFFVGGIAFTPNGPSAGFVSRWTDHNNTETGQNLHFDGTRLLLTQPSNYFVDKPSVAAAPGPNGQAYVYAAFVVFDQTDPKKLSSKIQFFRSTDSGVTWSAPQTVSQPLTRNQAPWIVVDPNNPQTVYIGWRVFAAQSGGVANAIVGRKSTNGGASFTPTVPYPVALLLKAFDQPQGSLPAGPPIPRSNAYPSAAMDGNGAIHVALQEYVYPANYQTVALRGLPLGPAAAPSIGVPRITVTTSYDGGSTWTTRKAIDLANGAGSQFMPAVTAVGEPGPSCAGKSGPKSRVAIVYYDAGSGGVGLTPSAANPNSYVAGGATQFDVRIAQASAGCGTSGLTFGPSEQLSQYTRTAAEGHGIVTTAGYGLTAVNRAYSNFCGGNCAFTGDYVGTSPRVPYVQNPAGAWVPTTASSVNKARLPAAVVVGVWADARDVKLPTMGANRAGTGVDALPWDQYSPPGTGQLSCINPGSRDQNVYAAEYTPGGLFAFAPETFRVSNIPRAYPVSVENRRATTALYELTIDAAANASFKYESFDVTRQPPVPLFKKTGIVVAPYSTVSGSVVIGPGVNSPVSVTVVEVDTNGVAVPNGATTAVTLYTAGEAPATDSETHAPLVSPTPIVSKPFGDRISPSNPLVVTPTTPFTQNPFSQNPFSQNPFSQNPFSQNPFSQNPFSQNPFTQNPFSQNPFSQNPFSQNPFSQNPFSQNALPIGDPTAPTAAIGAIYDVTDVSFVIVNGGNEAAAFSTLLNLEQSFLQTAPNNYLFQVLISKISLTPGLSDCQVIDRLQDLPVASFVTPFTQNPFSQNPFSQNPFSQNPFTQNPFSQNPFSQNPFTQNPFSQNPFSQNPFSQNPSPRDPVVTNSTFYLAPPATQGQTARQLLPGATPAAVPEVRQVRAARDTVQLRPARLQGPLPPAPANYRADRPFDAVLYTLRAYQISPAPPVKIVSDSGPNAGQAAVSVSVAAPIPNVVPRTGGGFQFDGKGVSYSSGGSGVPVQLAFVPPQPTSSTPNAAIAPPFVVAIQDGSHNTITTSTQAVTVALASLGGTLSGTLTRNAVNGLAMFDNLSIDVAGTYRLKASAVGVTDATSDPFSITASLVVTTTADSGTGSLRQAILTANAISGGSAIPITFNIPGTAPFTILPQTPLPTITRPMSIDATTQPGYAGMPIVMINGTGSPAVMNGFTVTGGSSLIRGFWIGGFKGYGILLQTGGGNQIAGNYIGTSWDGTGPFDPNPANVGQAGRFDNAIQITDSSNNLIGGTTGITPGGPCTGDCNLLVSRGGSAAVGAKGAVVVSSPSGTTADGNRVLGNFVGVDRIGSIGLAGPFDMGVIVTNAANTLIGDGTPAGRNVISGNNMNVAISTNTPVGTTVRGNYIGTNASGTATVVNNFGGGNGINFGVQAIGNNHLIDTNVLSGNSTGLSCGCTTSTVRGNLIGLNAAGTAAIPNDWGVWIQGEGINSVFGGTTAADRNVISGNKTFGIVLSNGSYPTPYPAVVGHRIIGNYIGTDSTGMLAVPNGATPTGPYAPPGGIFVNTGVTDPANPGIFIGGVNPGEGNLIAGNQGAGVIVQSTSQTFIRGNLIGTNATGATALGNTWGVLVMGAAGNTVGGAVQGAGNVISGNATGVEIATGSSNLVQGNIIGLSTTGTAVVGNSTAVFVRLGSVNNVIGGTSVAARNIISANIDGVVISDVGTSGNQVAGNYIGTDVSGTSVIGTGTWGVLINSNASNNVIGLPGFGNVIAGRTQAGVAMVNGASGNTLRGNFIGVDANGVAALGNAWGVIVSNGATGNIIGGGSAGEGNVISANANGNITLNAGTTATEIYGNVIGLNAAGTAGFGNTQQFGVNIVGASLTQIGVGNKAPSSRNTISGNQKNIQILGADGTRIFGNFLGTSTAGTSAIPNSGYGVFVEGATNTQIGDIGSVVEGNVISGNSTAVSILAASGESTLNNVIGSNWIGTRIDGTTSLPNGTAIVLQANPGGTLTGSTIQANTIAFNSSPAIVITGNGATNNPIRANSIFNNAAGIDLGADGVTPNDPADADAGPNNLQNFPTVTVASVTSVSGTLNSTANTTFNIELFANDSCSTRQGQTRVAAFTAGSNGAGNAFFAQPVSLSAGQYVTATATDPNGNTSEFSSCVATAPTFIVTNTNDSGAGSLRQAILDANADPDANHIRFNIPGTSLQTIYPMSPLPAITSPVFLDGESQPGWAGSPVIELNGSNGGTGTGLQILAGSSMVRGLLIEWFDLDGLLLQGGGGNVVQSNWVGPVFSDLGFGGNRANGIHIVDSADNMIGGPAEGAGNTVTGNSGEGVRIDGATATRNVVQGNVIGVVSLNIGSGNLASGVYIRRAPGNSVIGNDIEGNTGFAGVAICGAGFGFCGGGDIGNQTGDASGTIVQGNVISGNSGFGVSVDGAPNTLVGGADAAAANTITSSGQAGVVVFNPGSTGNQILRNTIIANLGLGIDLNGDGVTPNDASPDADTGPNNLQNYPVLTSAFSPNIIGTLDSAPNTAYTLQFFENDTGNLEAARFLLQTTVTTDANGHASFDITATITGDAWVTATATDPAGNTSEFAAPARNNF
jgi:Right handed beta helix region